MFRFYVSLFLLFLIAEICQSEINNIRFTGKVVDPFGVELPGVSVKIKALKLQTHTAQNGLFAFENIPISSSEGSSNLEFSFNFIGFQPKDTSLSITNLNTGNFVITLNINNVITDEVVVTGTRTIKEIENNPIPTQVVSREEINKSGNVRLDEALAEINGLNVVEFLGKGVQIQGLDESYALILLNGEPIIGTMSGGQINIDRLAVGNVSRIEIVKGPSSSLYGSSALAGVINLITNETPNKFDLRSTARFGTFNTMDLSSDVKYSSDNQKVSVNFFADFLRSDGYKVNETSVRKTIPDYMNYTLNGDIFYNFSRSTQAILRARFNNDLSENQFAGSDNTVKDEEANLVDKNISLTFKHRYSNRASVKSIFYYTSYDAETIFYDKATTNIFHKSYYNQSLGKFELQWDFTFAASHLLTFGSGVNIENVESDIILDSTASSKSFFGFAQHDWIITDKLNLISSLRFDSHSDYASSLNPKFAVSYELFDKFSLKASIGSGFKAPSPENLYLNWTNPTEGYSVFGVTGIREKFDELAQQGLITDTIIDPSKIIKLKPEHSLSFNLGATYEIAENLNVNLNLFRNEVSDMIEWQVIAENKGANQKYYSYFNLNSVYTQGLETNINYKLIFDKGVTPNSYMDFSLGYQYLETADRDVLEQIRDGEILKVGSTGVTRPVQEVEYGGLFNRSKHNLTVKIKYNNSDLGFSAFLRGSFRSRFGYQDKNGNIILDDDKEYINAYQLWNLTLSQELSDSFLLQLQSNNIFDTKEKELLITAGRTFFINIIYNLGQ